LNVITPGLRPSNALVSGQARPACCALMKRRRPTASEEYIQGMSMLDAAIRRNVDAPIAHFTATKETR